MGIPLHWEPPTRSPAASDAHAKRDPLAPSRSAIRRQRTVRRSHRNNNGSNSASSNRPGYVPFRSSMPHWVENLGRQVIGDGTAPSGAPTRSTNTTTNEPGTSRYASQDNESRLDWPASSSYSPQTRRDLVDRLARTSAIRYSSPSRRIRIPRESSLRIEMLQPPSWPPSDEPPRRSESSSNTTADSRVDNRLADMASYSPRFAPAYPSHSNERALLSSDSYDSNMPLLRRVGLRSIAETNNVDATRHRHIIDGLGDRDRSFSPSGESHHDDHDNNDPDDDDDDDDDGDDEPNMWESLFTTITPDDQLPTLDSSFTSATASASTAPSRSSANSSQLTLPSSLDSNNIQSRLDVLAPLEPFTDHTNHCDFFSSSEGSDTEPESDMEHEPTWRLLGRTNRPNPTRLSASMAALEDTIQYQQQQQQLRRQREENLLGMTRTIRSVIAEASANRNTNRNTNTASHPSSSTSPTSPTSTSTPTSINISFGQSSSMEDLQQVQTIIDQLTRRQDIDDEWWAAVGLSRNLGRGVTDVPARNGNENDGESGGNRDARER
ncbi:conserved hypothetical protein [Histoplasma capsulatum G186AR]|uniref:Uncharacterized protein n=1 Tax=Ajellomyces capsulatus (strain G186AR / H82 / ATCC MYA-2454 / RMSCC 2432) TaxID=447093 RepID=C0NIN4_AJECG|nr:uncharacterized protein HCBG_02291 [Histoplasma capsulatum G186AR]EEH08754.1 conserved hypothetical protein [Histoplasma capsulatum G186AR]